MVSAWARLAEFQIGEGNGASIEIIGAETLQGSPICYTISDAGIDKVRDEDDIDEDDIDVIDR